MLKISQIVNSLFTSKTYILEEDGFDYVWLTDCGDYDKILNFVSGKRIEGVLLTHSHFDHIYGLPALLKDFPDCKIVTNEMGLKMLGSDKLNMSKYAEIPVNVVPSAVILAKEGMSISLFEGIEAKVFDTPGHNPSCLSYAVEGYLFTGDSYMPGLKVITNLPFANKALAAESEARLKLMAGEYEVMPGHSIDT